MSRNRILTEEMIFMRTKCNRMELIRNLNLWGNDLCQIAELKRMKNLEVLSLSVNKIESLQDLCHCFKLTELYLRKNNIYDLSEVRHLRGLKQLKVLWLSDNPCATLPQYRLYVLSHLPNLMKLDSDDVTEEERRQAARADVSQMETDASPDCISHEHRRFSAPEMGAQDDFRERQLHAGAGAGAAGRRPMPAYEEQYMDQVDFQQMPQGSPYHGHPERTGASGMAYDDQSPEDTPRNGAEPRSVVSMPSVMPSYGHMQEPGGARRSGGYPDSHEGSMHQPRSAWASADSPETPTRARQGSKDSQTSGSGHRARFNGSGDRGVPHGDPYMYRGDPDGMGQADLGDLVVGGATSARADNILCAVLALIKELDQQGLELVRRAIEQRQSEL